MACAEKTVKTHEEKHERKVTSDPVLPDKLKTNHNTITTANRQSRVLIDFATYACAARIYSTEQFQNSFNTWADSYFKGGGEKVKF